MDHGAKKRLSAGSAVNFPNETLFDRFARAVCEAECLPRKELFETWEVAKRVRRRMKGGRVVDLACGHGLLAYAMLLLDPRSTGALAVDRRIPPSAAKLRAVLEARWPRLAGRVELKEGDLASVELAPEDVVVSIHACGDLTDRVLERAAAAGARVAVLPCCHPVGRSERGGLDGWLDGPLAVDVMRAGRLREQGYRVFTAAIPEEITPKNRLLMGCPEPRGW